MAHRVRLPARPRLQVCKGVVPARGRRLFVAASTKNATTHQPPVTLSRHARHRCARSNPVARSKSRYVCVLAPYPALPRFGVVLYAQFTGSDDCGLLRCAPFKRRRIDFPSHNTRSRCNVCEPGIKKAPAQHTQGLSATCLRKRWVTDEPRCLPGACRSDQWSRRRKQPGPHRAS